MSASLLVVVPTYDEAENVTVAVEAVLAAVPDAHVLVVDDNSPDGTGKIADELAADDPRVRVLHRLGKQGLGAAYVAGFGHALDHGYDLVAEMDADGSHRAVDLPALVAAARDGAALVIGSRWVPGGSVENWPLHREVLSRGANVYARLWLGIDVRDATGGFRVFARRTLQQIDLDAISSRGYCFQIDLTLRVADAGLSIREVPITFVERVRGESKMSSDIVREALWRVTAWGFRRRLARLRRALVRRR